MQRGRLQANVLVSAHGGPKQMLTPIQQTNELAEQPRMHLHPFVFGQLGGCDECACDLCPFGEQGHSL